MSSPVVAPIVFSGCFVESKINDTLRTSISLLDSALLFWIRRRSIIVAVDQSQKL
ncbi:hypothetical protein U1Q18_012795, partial [Sarracenia purpurea var. burkii]